VRQPSAVDDWFYERRREEIRRVSSVERAEDFRAHQRMLARFLEAGKQFRAQRTKK
jgi:hypothetical protein